jgi:tetratricopeptide (TPR) repeat protein
MESVEQFAKSDSNVDDLSLIQDGLTKQHFIELEPFLKLKGDLYEKHLITNEWRQSDHPVEKKRDSVPRSESQQEDIFTTEVSQRVLENARKRLSSSVMSLNQTPLLVRQKNSINEIDSQQLLSETPDQIKEHLHNRAMMFYEKAFELFEEEKYEQTIVQLKKAFSLDSFNVQFYLLKCEAFIQLCDFNSAISTLNKLISILSLYTHHGDTDYDKLKKNIREKITFCYYMLGQTYLDNKLYVNALEAFSKASELMPNILNFKVRR